MVKIKYFIGIDNGVNGAIVVLDRDYDIVDRTIMPVFGGSKKEYDVQTIVRFLSLHGKDSFAILEKAQPQFRDGRKQAFKTGYGFGVMEGILYSLKIPFQIIAPKTWQKKIFEGLNTDDTKAASILFAKRKWPCEDWRASERCKKDHDGLTDAACMSYYGGIISNV